VLEQPPPAAPASGIPDPFVTAIGRKAELIEAARPGEHGAIWAGLGLSGLIGWSVAVPTVAAALLGGYLDRRFPSQHSLTLAFLAVGLVAGCINAWRWVNQEDQKIHHAKGAKDV
jgi:ATP synthase protein I